LNSFQHKLKVLASDRTRLSLYCHFQHLLKHLDLVKHWALLNPFGPPPRLFHRAVTHCLAPQQPYAHLVILFYHDLPFLRQVVQIQAALLVQQLSLVVKARTLAVA
jgi:hypothetical protein